MCYFREVKMSAMYTKMFDHLKTLKVENWTKYDGIIHQLPHGTDWIAKIAGNVHLLSVLCFKPCLQNQVNVLRAEIKLFLSSPAWYKETIEGLLEFRRNGQAHLEKDYSMDSFRKKASLIAAVAALKKKQPVLSLGQQYLHFMVAGATSDAIHMALQAYKKRRLEVATAAAVAAAETIATYNIPFCSNTAARNLTTSQLAAVHAAQGAAKLAAQAAMTQAAAAAKQQYGKGKKQKYPMRMFTATQVEHMFSAALPGYLTSFQMAMFLANELENVLTSFQMAMFLANELENVQLEDEPIVAPLLHKP